MHSTRRRAWRKKIIKVRNIVLNKYNDYENESPKKRKFKLFDMNRDGKGVYEEENRKPTFAFFFKLYFRKFTQILQLNLLMIFQIIPIAVFAIAYFVGTKTPTALNTSYSALHGINKIIASPSVTALLDTSSIHMGIPIFSPPILITFICLGVIMILTYGWQNVGAAYVLRGLYRGDPVFVFTDFFYGIKKNFKQGFVMGLLDMLFTVVLVVDFIFFFTRGGTFLLDFMYIAIFAIVIIYIIMRFYIYQLLITFELKNFKILKNALIFTALGIKRNIMALLGCAVLIIINFILIIYTLPLGISVMLIIPLFYLLGTLSFISTYAAYPVISKYMIEPYQTEVTDTTEEIE